MDSDSTRRAFLGAGVAGAALITQIQPLDAAVLTPGEHASLALAMELIIPAGDGMPSARDAGGLEYLDALARRDPRAASDIAGALAVLEAFGTRSAGRSFAALDTAGRVATLKAMEAEAAPQFATLRDYVYESYYTQPRVWKLIGYELYPTDHSGPLMAPFDEALVQQVQARPKLWRED